jgi:RNA polymerase sigma-70 factor, ECF subfamily
VLMMRDVEQLSTTETADALQITEENVKVRLHRARAMVRRDLFERVGATSAAAFQFGASRCDRVTSEVMRRVGEN